MVNVRLMTHKNVIRLKVLPTIIIMETKHILSVINAAVNNGFEFDITDSMEEIWHQAEEVLLENEPEGHRFVHCHLGGHGMSQYYNFVEADGTEHDCTGDIFDFPKLKTDDEVYFKKDGETFTPCNWFDVPNDDDKDYANYVFVFDKVVCADGSVAYLYDHMA